MGVLAISSSVFAVANPTNISLHTSKVFQNLFETGDMLFVASYDVDYTVEPDESAPETFLINLIDTDGSTLLMSRAINYYQYNVISIYATAAQVASIGLTWGSEYKVRVTGSPAHFGTLTEGTNMRTKTLSESDWNADGVSTSDELLATHIVNLAETLEVEWVLVLLVTTATGNSVLNSVGRITFLDAIPSINIVLPGSFQASSSTVVIDEVTSTGTLETETLMSSKLGTSISNAFVGVGEWLGISEQMSGAIWAMLFLLTIASIVFLNSGNNIGAVICATPVFIGLSFLGALPMGILFTIALLLCAYTGYFIFLRGI